METALSALWTYLAGTAVAAWPDAVWPPSSGGGYTILHMFVLIIVPPLAEGRLRPRCRSTGPSTELRSNYIASFLDRRLSECC